jgi:hypothetical protein
MARTSINIYENIWTKVATAATSGMIRQPEDMGEFNFAYTIRDTGGVAPVDVDATDGGLALPLFEGGRDVPINNSPAIDVYVRAKNANKTDTDTARVVVDL